MKTLSLDTTQLKKLLSLGKLDKVIKGLIQVTENTSIDMASEVYHTSARYRRLEEEKTKGLIAYQDYNLELNSITTNLLDIINTFHSLDPMYLKTAPSKEDLKKEIEALSKEFDNTEMIISLPSRLRSKIHIARKMAEKLITRPELIKEYKDTTNQAIICAISRKVKMIPDIDELYVLEANLPNATSTLTKGFIANALAELIYSGQLRLGDDYRVHTILDFMKKDADPVLIKNISFIETALNVVTGKIKI